MPFLITTLLSLALAWVRGAPPTRLAQVHLRWLILPLLSFVIQSMALVRFESTFVTLAPWLHLGSLALLMAFFVANLRYRSLAVVGVGVLLNLIVIASNGGFMPARVADVERIGFADVAAQLEANGRFQKSTVLHDGTTFPWLADVIRLPLPGPDRLISLGDIFVALGAFLFLQEALVRRQETPRSQVQLAGQSAPT